MRSAQTVRAGVLGIAAPVLRTQFSSTGDLPPVWPLPRGAVRGRALKPLYPSVPAFAPKDERLYSALALLDALRAGSARDRDLAARLLSEILMPKKAAR